MGGKFERVKVFVGASNESAQRVPHTPGIHLDLVLARKVGHVKASFGRAVQRAPHDVLDSCAPRGLDDAASLFLLRLGLSSAKNCIR